MPRTGDEPSTARSPLALRAVLAAFGLTCGVVGLVGLAIAGRGWPAAAFGLLGLVAAVDLAVVVHHIRQGAHFQPGPDVPPYRPVNPRPASGGRTAPAGSRAVPPRRRLRIYLAMMSTCLVLLIVAWTWVRLHSTVVAVVMTVIAMVIPPLAAFVANIGALPPEGPSSRPSP